jgi:hypothetical protein
VPQPMSDEVGADESSTSSNKNPFHLFTPRLPFVCHDEAYLIHRIFHGMSGKKLLKPLLFAAHISLHVHYAEFPYSKVLSRQNGAEFYQLRPARSNLHRKLCGLPDYVSLL